jgi:hypothetical protein
MIVDIVHDHVRGSFEHDRRCRENTALISGAAPALGSTMVAATAVAATNLAPCGICPWVMVGPVLDYDNPPSGNGSRVIESNRRRSLNDSSPRVDSAYSRDRPPRLLGGVDLVHDDHIGRTENGLSGVVATGVVRAKRVRDDDVEIRPEEREVIVASAPR